MNRCIAHVAVAQWLVKMVTQCRNAKLRLCVCSLFTRLACKSTPCTLKLNAKLQSSLYARNTIRDNTYVITSSSDYFLKSRSKEDKYAITSSLDYSFFKSRSLMNVLVMFSNRAIVTRVSQPMHQCVTD